MHKHRDKGKTDSDILKKELQADFERQSVKLKERESKLADFCSQTGRRADTFRTQVYGFDRNVSGRAVWGNKRVASLNTAESRFTGNIEIFNNGQNDIILPRNIEKNLNKSEIGKEILKYLNEKPCKICMYYNVDVDGMYGQYDFSTDEIIIYASKTKTVQKTAETIIHEVTHRRYNLSGDLHAEAVCFAQELKHKNNTNILTFKEKRDIIKKVRTLYAEFKWRK